MAVKFHEFWVRNKKVDFFSMLNIRMRSVGRNMHFKLGQA